jgi:hypothetical protein
MAIYRKGDDLTPLQNAATEQKQARKDAGTDARAEAGLGGSGQRGGKPRLGNLSIETSTGKAYSRDYQSGQTGPDGKKPKVYHNDVQVSGGAIAAHDEKRVRLGRKEATEKVDRNRKSSKPAGKAPVKLVREMLGKGTLTIGQAEKANKRGLTSPIKKKKTK